MAELNLKEQVEAALATVAAIKQFGIDAQNFADEIQSLVTEYDDAKVARLYDIFWNNLNANLALFQQQTADSLWAVAPVAKELHETNKLLKIIK